MKTNYFFTNSLGLALCSLLIFFLPNQATAQEINVSEEIAFLASQSYSVLGKFDNKLLLLTGKDKDYEIKAYNADLQLSWNKAVKLEGNYAEALAVLGTTDAFYLIYKYKFKGESIVKVNKYNAAAKLIADEILINYGKQIHIPTPSLVFSENKHKVLLYNMEYFADFEVASFDLAAMKQLWVKNFTPVNLDFENEFRQMLVNNEGSMYMALTRNNRKLKKDAAPFLEVICHAPVYNISTAVQINMENRLSYDVDFRFDNQEKILIAGGLFSNKNFKQTEGFYTLKIPVINPSQYLLAFENYPSSLLTRLQTKAGKSSLSNVGVQSIIFKEDKGVLLVCEEVQEFQRSSVSGFCPLGGQGGNGAGPIRKNYNYGDLFLIATNSAGDFEWENILNRKTFYNQKNQNYASHFIAETSEELRLVYNDKFSSDNIISEYVIQKDGAVNRNTLYNLMAENLKMQYYGGIQVAENEIIIPVLQKNNLKLIQMLF